MTSYERFKNLCAAHGYSARQVALKTGVDPATISHWKKGEYTPKYESRKAIAKFFGVTVEYLDEGKTEDEITKERLKMRDEEKALASVAKDASPEQLRMAIAFLKTIMTENE